MSFDVDTDELNRDSNLSAFLASKKAAIDVEVLKVGFRPPADALPASRCVARSPSGKLHDTLKGFGTYGKTMEKAKPKEQRDNTLLVTKELLPLVSHVVRRGH